MEGHKPEREDEQNRIKDLGGIVAFRDGIGRVNGNLSVSRSIGLCFILIAA